jgi:Cu2+-exporting ATPase
MNMSSRKPDADAAEHHHHDHHEPVTDMQSPEHAQHATPIEQSADHAAHGDDHGTEGHESKDSHAGHDAHAGHGVMHEGHLTMMRNRFFVALPLTIVVVLYSPMVQQWLGFTMPQFPGSRFIAPILGSIVFFYGGLPFLSMARQELAQRQPGMMTLISLAITTAYLYSLAIFFFPPVDEIGMQAGGMLDFFWELATLITVMLLGHWIELRSVGQARGALRELAKLLPDTAQRLLPSGETEMVEVGQLKTGDRVLIRPGASIPADGVVAEGESSVNESMITGEPSGGQETGDTVIGEP